MKTKGFIHIKIALHIPIGANYMTRDADASGASSPCMMMFSKYGFR